MLGPSRQASRYFQQARSGSSLYRDPDVASESVSGLLSNIQSSHTLIVGHMLLFLFCFLIISLTSQESSLHAIIEASYLSQPVVFACSIIRTLLFPALRFPFVIRR